jgi:protein-tyrosine phosphatase
MIFILNNLAIGDYKDALNPSPEIRAMLCVAREKDITETDGILYYKVPIIDMQPIPVTQLKESVQWIKEQISEHRILVFCNAGVGRSTSVVVSYFCCVLGYSFGHAVEYIATRKPYMSTLPNLKKDIEELRKQTASYGRS